MELSGELARLSTGDRTEMQRAVQEAEATGARQDWINNPNRSTSGFSGHLASLGRTSSVNSPYKVSSFGHPHCVSENVSGHSPAKYRLHAGSCAISLCVSPDYTWRDQYACLGKFRVLCVDVCCMFSRLALQQCLTLSLANALYHTQGMTV